jgi:pimeloyl-ACP methyl ester carboxylesterase
MKTFLTSLAVSLRNHIRAGIGILFIALLSGSNNPDGIIWDEMQRAEINGVELAIYDHGTGEPVVFIHGASGDEVAAVLREPALADRYRLIHFHRRGYGISERPESFVTTEQDASDAKAVMEYLGIERAHFVGQSGGGIVLLQVLRDFPDAVHSAALLEPALMSFFETTESSQTLWEAFATATSLHEAGDDAGAAETFLSEVCGENFREIFDQTMPEGWFERSVAEINWYLSHSEPAGYSWSFSAEDAKQFSLPVLNMAGENTKPYFMDAYNELSMWFPQAENVVLPDANHCIHHSNPAGAAEYQADFFSRHPIND